MERTTKVLLQNMCMIEADDKYLALNKVNKSWNGITFPGGHVEDGESLIQSTIREVKEETGLHIKNLKLCGVVSWYGTKTKERQLVFLYKTKDFSGELLEGTVEGKLYWMSKQELYNSKLAAGMENYLKLFMNDEYSEAYATWDENSYSDFEIM